MNIANRIPAICSLCPQHQSRFAEATIADEERYPARHGWITRLHWQLVTNELSSEEEGKLMRVSGDSGLRAIVSVAFCVALGGCATGFNRGEMDAALQSAKPSYVSSELSVEEIDALRPQVNLPARIAIAPPIQTYQRWWGQRSLDTWSPDEIAILESWQEPLRSAGVASEILILPSSLVKDCEVRDSLCRLKSQRAAAARVHADALLVINLATATDEYVNPASALYLTIIGMWLVPASHRDALTVAEGVLLDTRNEYLYAFARGEGESQSVRPAMYADTVAVVGMSRVEALRDFGGSFLEQARHLRVK